MDSEIQSIMQRQLGRKIGQRVIFTRLDFAHHWTQKDLAAIRQAGLSVSQAIALLAFDKEMAALPIQATAAGHGSKPPPNFLADYRKDPRDFYVKLNRLTRTYFNKTRPAGQPQKTPGRAAPAMAAGVKKMLVLAQQIRQQRDGDLPELCGFIPAVEIECRAC